MIVHLVMFRPRADLAPEARAALSETMAATIREVPAIRRARVGRRVSLGRGYESQMRTDYTHVALLEFDDLDAVRTYLDHPAHAQLATRFFESFEEALMYDYEMGEGEAGVRGLSEG